MAQSMEPAPMPCVGWTVIQSTFGRASQAKRPSKSSEIDSDPPSLSTTMSSTETEPVRPFCTIVWTRPLT